MAVWRTLITVAALLCAGGEATAQTYTLAETAKPGDCFQLHLEMTLTGRMTVTRASGPASLPLQANAKHDFPERVLSVGAGNLPDKCARVYDTAEATIRVDGHASERGLRRDRRLVVSQRSKDQLLTYSPAGPLLREEQELTSEHFDTLYVSGLLPASPVAVGDTWKVPNLVVQALCSFEGMTEQSLTCKLQEVKDGLALVTFSGSAAGIDLGALVKVDLEGSYRFDLASQRLTQLEWKQKDEREQGPASPATTVQSTTLLMRKPIDRPAALSDENLISVPDGFDPPLPLTQLEYHDPKGRFDLVYGRNWQTVSQTEEHLVMRLIDRGDFVAQVTVTPWTKAEKGQHLSPEEFKQAMAETPGWEPEEELQTGEVPATGSQWIYRLAASGQLDGAKVLQNFYLVASPAGEQLVLVFTMTPKQADHLGTQDLSLAASIDFPSSHK
jgi:hypothetical protein